MDKEDGFYITASLTLARKEFPLAIQTIVNQPFTTTIPGGDDFVWNISLIYSFYRDYIGK